uniref:Large ribosomal subunit protein P2 n=1 Tax=Homalodisca liturata TaxID=320908 RepID=A0A1B6H5R3_9HEMI
MRYLASYLLAALGGKDNPSSADLEKILNSVGIEVDNEKLNIVISQLKGKNIEELIAQGREKLSSMPVGGGAAVAAAGPGAAAPAAAKEEAKEEKKPAKEESDQSDDDMGFGLFD